MGPRAKATGVRSATICIEQSCTLWCTRRGGAGGGRAVPSERLTVVVYRFSSPMVRCI